MKKAIALLAAVSLFASPAIAEDAPSLTVTIDGIETVSGSINLGVFDKAGYDSGKAVDGALIAVDSDTLTVSFSDLAPGTYGVKLYHDVNGNGEMDTNPFGMPTEPYAFSNNAKGRFGPATWDKAAFDVAENGTIHTITIE